MAEHITHHATLAGLTTWELLDPSGAVIRTGTRHNLILDTGLDHFGMFSPDKADNFNQRHSAWRRYLALGTSSAAPVATQTTLGAEVLRTDASDGFEGTEGGAIQGGALVHTVTHVRVASFSGAFNLTEYGLSPYSGANGTLSIRELFRDGGGNPTVISVQAGMKLKLTHTLTLSLPLALPLATVNLAGLGDVSARSGVWSSGAADFSNIVIYTSCVWLHGSAFAITSRPLSAAGSGDPTTAPQYLAADPASITRQPYVAGSRQLVKSVQFNEADANGTHYGWGIGWGNGMGYTGTRAELVNPASLAKDDTKRLTVNFVASWGRA